MILLACGCLHGTTGVLNVVFFIAVGMMGTYKNPFVWLRYPVSILWLCLKTWSLSLLNRERQLLLQSFPMDRRLLVRRLGRICPVWDRAYSAVDSGIVTRFVAFMVSLFTTRTAGPFYNVVILSQYCLEDG